MDPCSSMHAYRYRVTSTTRTTRPAGTPLAAIAVSLSKLQPRPLPRRCRTPGGDEGIRCIWAMATRPWFRPSVSRDGQPRTACWQASATPNAAYAGRSPWQWHTPRTGTGSSMGLPGRLAGPAHCSLVGPTQMRTQRGSDPSRAAMSLAVAADPTGRCMSMADRHGREQQQMEGGTWPRPGKERSTWWLCPAVWIVWRCARRTAPMRRRDVAGKGRAPKAVGYGRAGGAWRTTWIGIDGCRVIASIENPAAGRSR